MEEDILVEKDRIIEYLSEQKKTYFESQKKFAVLGAILAVIYYMFSYFVATQFSNILSVVAGFFGTLFLVCAPVHYFIQRRIEASVDRRFDRKIEEARIERARIARRINGGGWFHSARFWWRGAPEGLILW